MKRALASALFLALVLGMVGIPAGARHLPAANSFAAIDTCAGFADVTVADPACAAIAALTAAGVIKGYATTPPTFGPHDPVQRAQVAAFLVRALGWWDRPALPREFADFGALVDELRRASLILANACDAAGKCVAQGYVPADCARLGLPSPCFGPIDPVSFAQVIAFISRAFQVAPDKAWLPQPGGALPYQGVPAVHADDVRTYHYYAGPIPDAPTTLSAWTAPAPRSWVARALFQALKLPTPPPTPTPTATPVPPMATQTTPPIPPTATPTPTATVGRAGNGALSFDGVDDEARGGLIAGTAGTQTIEAWYRPSTADQSSLILVNSDDVLGWIVELYQGQLRVWMANTGGAWHPLTQWGTTLAPGTWYHLAVTYDAGTGTARLFLNGAAGFSEVLGPLSQGPQFRLGGLAPHPFLAGQLDEVRLSSTIRYSGAFTPPAAAFVPDSATLALYHFDEGSGQTLVDASGNGHTLTLGATAAAEGSDPARVASTAPTGGALAPTPTPTATPGAGSGGVRVVGPGFTDAAPKQLVRTSGDRLYAIVNECDQYPYHVGDRLIVYRANQTGIPSTFTQFIQASLTDIGTVAVALNAADDIEILTTSRAGALAYRVWDTGTDTMGSATTIDTELETNLGQGDTNAALALDASGVAHIVYLKSDGTRRRAYYRNNSGGSWSAATDVTSGITFGSNQKAWTPSIAVDGSGRVLVAWTVGTFNSTAGTTYSRVRSAAGPWGSAVAVGASYTAIDQSNSLLVTADGRYHLTFVEAITGSGDERIRYYYSDNQGTTWTANHPGGGAQNTHNPTLGPGPGGTLRIYGHGAVDGANHGQNIYRFQGSGGSASWGTWTLYATGTNYDSSVATRWAQFFHHHPERIDVAFWDDRYPNQLLIGTE